MAHQLETDIAPFTYTSYYSDNIHPTVTQCTGDAGEYGASGVWVNNPIPNTDPELADQYGYLDHLTFTRILYYEPAGQTVQTAGLRYSQATAPLVVQASAHHPTCFLTLTIVNPTWGQVTLNPAPTDANDPNRLIFPLETPVTLTATPIEGKYFGGWTIYDPTHPNDANFAAVDANNPLTIVMSTDIKVQTQFRCSSGAGPMVPLMATGLLAFMVVGRRR
jgi:hypothetical protein